VLRHQIAIPQRPRGGTRLAFRTEERGFVAPLPARYPREVPHRLRLLVRPDTRLAATVADFVQP
jgi:hypothetical protein